MFCLADRAERTRLQMCCMPAQSEIAYGCRPASQHLASARRRNRAWPRTLSSRTESFDEQQNVSVSRRACTCLGPSLRTARLAARHSRPHGPLSHRERNAAAGLAGHGGADARNARRAAVAPGVLVRLLRRCRYAGARFDTLSRRSTGKLPEHRGYWTTGGEP